MKGWEGRKEGREGGKERERERKKRFYFDRNSAVVAFLCPSTWSVRHFCTSSVEETFLFERETTDIFVNNRLECV